MGILRFITKRLIFMVGVGDRRQYPHLFYDHGYWGPVRDSTGRATRYYTPSD